ncbi:MAG: class I SAM-dependent methyltransferase [Gammaproteobacteria bacterium]|nr:class I SAM-dependent methyltransferase [Gammaproteobacteria bacterium]
MLDQLNNLLKTSHSNPWKVEDFCGIDQLHLGGIPATLALIDGLPTDAKHGLDIGCGLGGTSRLLSKTRACHMVGLDLNEQYIKAADLLNKAIKPAPKCQFVVGNSLHLPFSKDSFNFVISQHATMNIGQKEALLKGLYAVLKPQGYLLIHEVMLSPNTVESGIESQVRYPTPWANEKSDSRLCDWQTFSDLAEKTGFKIQQFEDNTASALTWIRQARKQKPQTSFNPQLVLGALAGQMSGNVLSNIEQGLLQIVSARLYKQ